MSTPSAFNAFATFSFSRVPMENPGAFSVAQRGVEHQYAVVRYVRLYCVHDTSPRVNPIHTHRSGACPQPVYLAAEHIDIVRLASRGRTQTATERLSP